MAAKTDGPRRVDSSPQLDENHRVKIVTCYVSPDQLRDETLEALIKHRAGADIHMRSIDPNDDLAYMRVIKGYWEAQDDFMIVEPDIVIRADVTEAFKNCGCEYGCFPYAWKTDVGPALGCTWFRASFLRKYPTAVWETGNVSWRQFDVVLMRHVLARKYGEQPHVHLPPVTHLNEEKQLLPEASSEPLMQVPHW